LPRRPRELIDGGIYHVFNRGNGKMSLFCDELDFRYFLASLRASKEKWNAELYHYCLMPNHFHLLLKILHAGDLGRLMHQLQLGYARYFQKKYGFAGHIFGQRFRSPRIPTDSYYLQCGRYIERNPVNADLVKISEEYPYSSARFYARGQGDPLVNTNMHYDAMGFSGDERQAKYREFLSTEEPYRSIIEDVLDKA
jgi:putative transposase